MRTFTPPTSFVSSPETEKLRLLYACDIVASGFYTRHGLLVLPKAVQRYKSYCEVLPEIVKNFSPLFWKDAERCGKLMSKKLSKRMWKEAKSINLEPVDKVIVQDFENKWKTIEKQSWNALSGIFPKEVRWIGSLEVRVTKIGSLGSHFLLSKKKGQHLIINLRQDSNYLDIVNLLVLALIYPLANDLRLSFTHRQTVRNFIMSRSAFKAIYPEFEPKTFDHPKIPAYLKKRSQEYIQHLGIPKITDPIVEIQKNPEIFGSKEEKLLEKLIKNRGEIVTYDEIADTLWGAGNFKTYWAINKIVQRIQNKARKIGIDNLEIIGVRGRGYKLG